MSQSMSPLLLRFLFLFSIFSLFPSNLLLSLPPLFQGCGSKMERTEGTVGLWPVGVMGKTYKNGRELEEDLIKRGYKGGKEVGGKGAKGGKGVGVRLGGLVRVRGGWGDRERALRAVETRGLKPTVVCRVWEGEGGGGEEGGEGGLCVSLEKYTTSFLKGGRGRGRGTKGNQEEEWCYQVLSGREGFEVYHYY